MEKRRPPRVEAPVSPREVDLYLPVRHYLSELGYVVRGEVQGCDVTGVRGNEVVVVELKRRLSLDLLIQATHRQHVADRVYIAVPAPRSSLGRRNVARWKGIERLLRRLELGLLFVTVGTGPPRVTVRLHPSSTGRKLSGKRRALLNEVAGRSGEYTSGGITRQPICTAYREAALFIACCLERRSPMRPAELRALGCSPKTQSILASNFYGWFQRVARGLYTLSAEGHAALDRYPDLVPQLRRALSERTSATEAPPRASP